MTAQILRHESDTSPGGTITVSVWVWSTAPARHVSATVASSAHALLRPQFTLCPVKRGTTCSIGALPANQAFELTVTDKVKPTARIGRPIALAVTVSARGESPAEAAVAAVVGQGIKPPSVPPTLPPTTLIPLPGATITPGALSSLFPVVTPQPSTPSASSPPAHGRKVTRITETSSALPLDSRLIGPQLAGLAVLAAAITMVVARLSLRPAQAPAGSGTGGSDTGESGTGGPGPGEADDSAEAASDDKASDDKSAS